MNGRRFGYGASIIGTALLALGAAAFASGKKTPTTTSSLAPSAPPIQSINLVMPSSGNYEYTVIPAVATVRNPELPVHFSGSSATVTVTPSKGKGTNHILILNEETGNAALLPIPAKSATLQVTPEDFNLVRRVIVAVESNAKPLAAALVSLTDADNRTQTRSLDATDQGKAVFSNVAFGIANLSVVYGQNLKQTQDITIPSGHPATGYTVTVSVTGSAPTLSVPAAATTAPTPPQAGSTPTPPGNLPPVQSYHPSNQWPSIFGGLLGLIIFVGGGYLLYRWTKSGGAAATLKKWGIEVAAPSASTAESAWQPAGAAPPPVVTDPNLCPYCGQKKDASGNCGCTVGGGFAGGAATATRTGTPRLIGAMGIYSGNIYPITGGSVSVGRDSANTIALADDTTVSRRHAEIQLQNGGAVVRDLGSANGTFVNGVRISGEQALRAGDEIQIGNTRFRFEI